MSKMVLDRKITEEDNRTTKLKNDHEINYYDRIAKASLVEINDWYPKG